MRTDPRRERISAVIRDFFKDKPPGTEITEAEMARYRKAIRQAAERLEGDPPPDESYERTKRDRQQARRDGTDGRVPEMRPKDGDVVMHCDHVGAAVSWIHYETPFTFRCSDGTRVTTSWIAFCSPCHQRYGDKVMNYMRAVTWSRDALLRGDPA